MNDDFDIFAAAEQAVIENAAGRSTFPIIDCERENTYEVLDDFGVIETHHEPTDSFHALAVRVAYGADGFEIQVGEYNFINSEIDVLCRALMAYYRYNQPPLPPDELRARRIKRAAESPAGPADAP